MKRVSLSLHLHKLKVVSQKIWIVKVSLASYLRPNCGANCSVVFGSIHRTPGRSFWSFKWPERETGSVPHKRVRNSPIRAAQVAQKGMRLPLAARSVWEKVFSLGWGLASGISRESCLYFSPPTLETKKTIVPANMKMWDRLDHITSKKSVFALSSSLRAPKLTGWVPRFHAWPRSQCARFSPPGSRELQNLQKTWKTGKTVLKVLKQYATVPISLVVDLHVTSVFKLLGVIFQLQFLVSLFYSCFHHLLMMYKRISNLQIFWLFLLYLSKALDRELGPFS